MIFPLLWIFLLIYSRSIKILTFKSLTNLEENVYMKFNFLNVIQMCLNCQLYASKWLFKEIYFLQTFVKKRLKYWHVNLVYFTGYFIYKAIVLIYKIKRKIRVNISFNYRVIIRFFDFKQNKLKLYILNNLQSKM